MMISVLQKARAFLRGKRGNVAMMFAISLVPMTIAAGVGLDYAREAMVRNAMNEALDAAALAVGSSNGTLSAADAAALAKQYFQANYKGDAADGTPTCCTVTYNSNGSVTVSATDQVPVVLLNAGGAFPSQPVTASSTVVWGQTRLWVALVLDNTGSMCEPDSNPCPNDTKSTIKINALKTASHNLLATLQNASTNPGDVQVAVIPFSKDVNVGKSNYAANWLDFTSWDAANGSNQRTCTGGYFGWGYGNCTTTWVPASHTTWNGCVMDRTQNYDINNTTPTSTATDFPAEQYSNCPEAMLPLGYDWTKLSNEIDGMYAGGSTNQPIGLAWGWQALTQGAPMNPPALPSNTSRYMIILSDGLNTQDRWYGDGVNQSSQVDARESSSSSSTSNVCNNAKADGIVIYTVFVDLNGTQGSSTVLKNCASDSTKYFDLTTSGAIITTFNTIAQQITAVRVSQ